MRPFNSDGHSTVQPFWAIGLASIAVVLVATSATDQRVPMVALSTAAFAAGQVLFPKCRVRRANYLGPLNWAILVFCLQLVVLPSSILVFGASQGTLPNMPSAGAMNIALVLSTVAYAAFCVGAQLSAVPRQRRRTPRSYRTFGSMQYLHVATAFAALGLIGFYLAFGEPARMLEFFTDPGALLVEFNSRAGSIRHFAGIVLRPFLSFAAVMVWCHWVQNGGRRAGRLRRVAITAACLLVVGATGLSFSFNRAGALVPMIAIAAVYSARVVRLRFLSIALAALVVYPVAVGVGAYRSGGISVDQILDEAALSNVGMQRHDWVGTIQVYGAAPQFLGFMLERGQYGRDLYWGRTLVSSALYPLPVLGKPFRPTSGVVIYNEMIYGSSGFLDQNVPFQGELFLNFHLAGVVAAFALLGWLTIRLQARFDMAVHPVDQYVWMIVAIWVLFLVQGGLSVVSQIFVFFFWPVYAFALWRWFRGTSRAAIVSEVWAQASASAR